MCPSQSQSVNNLPRCAEGRASLLHPCATSHHLIFPARHARKMSTTFAPSTRVCSCSPDVSCHCIARSNGPLPPNFRLLLRLVQRYCSSQHSFLAPLSTRRHHSADHHFAFFAFFFTSENCSISSVCCLLDNFNQISGQLLSTSLLDLYGSSIYP